MNIAFLIDDDYSEQLAVTIISILKNSSQNIFNFYVLDAGISEENKTKILKLKKYKDFNIEFLNFDLDYFKNLPISGHLKFLNYARILLPSLVNCNKILFLDCDLLVLGDLSRFYNSSFDDNYACVVKERLLSEARIQKHIQKLNINSYFNAGVMLLNLDKMRKDNIQEKCLRFIEEHPEKLLLLDQCVLNYAFGEKVKFLEKKYNYQYKLGFSPKYKEAIVLHFVGAEKPYYGYAHPYENLYFSYLKLTPYRQSLFVFKNRMWQMYFFKLKKRICLYTNCMICLDLREGLEMFNWFKKKEEKIQLQENEIILDAEKNLEYLEENNFSKSLRILKRKLKNKTVIVYGAGAFFQLIQKYYDISDLNIIGISDMRFEEHEENETAFGYKVYAPNEICTLNPDYILVATKNYMTIIENLYYNIAKHSKTKIKVMVTKNFWTLLKEI